MSEKFPTQNSPEVQPSRELLKPEQLDEWNDRKYHIEKVGDEYSVVILGETHGHIGGSEYLNIIHKRVCGDAPRIDLYTEKCVQEMCSELIYKGLINSAHDISDGGLAIALAECCILSPEQHLKFGAKVNFTSELRNDFLFFGEDQSRIIVSTSSKSIKEIEKISKKYRVALHTMGIVTNGEFTLGKKISLSIDRIKEVYENSLVERIEV